MKPKLYWRFRDPVSRKLTWGPADVDSRWWGSQRRFWIYRIRPHPHDDDEEGY